jgi:hypothetical protein
MQWMKRLCGLGAAMLLGATVLLPSSGASAIGINQAEVYTLPLLANPNPADPPTLDLGDPLPGNARWHSLNPLNPSDPIVDYTATVVGVGTGSGAGTPSDAWVYNLTFTVTWNGNIGGAVPTNTVLPQMVFAILDSRFEDTPGGNDYASTNDLFYSGFVRGTFAVNGNSVTPQIVRDATVGGGFVEDSWYNYDFLGVNLPAVAGQSYLITMQWALGETPDMSGGGNRVFFPQALFVATVPEPGTAVLLGVALVGMLGVARRARHRGA